MRTVAAEVGAFYFVHLGVLTSDAWMSTVACRVRAKLDMDGDELDAMLASLAAEDAATDAAFTVSVEQEAAAMEAVQVRADEHGVNPKSYASCASCASRAA